MSRGSGVGFALVVVLVVVAWLFALLALSPTAGPSPLDVSSVRESRAAVDASVVSRGTARTSPPTPSASAGGSFPGHRTAVGDQEVRATPDARRTTRQPVGEAGAGGASWPGYVDAALDCIRGHESDTAGGYTAVNPTSGAAGAYQMLPSLSDDWARRYGHPEWASLTADRWPPAVQDHVAAQLYMDWPGAWSGSGC